MPTPLPTFRARNKRFEIDHCEPQRRALQDGKITFHALSKGHYLGTPIPRNILPGLSTVGFWNTSGRPDWGLDAHRNEGIEIMFLETGQMAFMAEGRDFALQAGHFTITRPWQLHKLGRPHIGPSRLHWLILDVGVRRPHQAWRWPKWLLLTRQDQAELTRLLRHNENLVWTATPAITESFRELADCVVHWSQPHAVSRLAAHLNLLLVRVLTTLTRRPLNEDKALTSPRRTVKIFLDELEGGRLDISRPWTLEQLAAHSGMSKSTLSKYCLELANVSPMEFLNRCRLENAARQLRADPNRSITDVALGNGFNSSQYFATAFAKHFKTSPTRHRCGG